jgi:hypothetical protein
MLVLSCWYFYRDKNEGKIKLVSLLSVVVSLAYSVYKFIAVYPLTEMGAGNTEFINYQALQYAFCIFQYIVNILMLVCINKHYQKKEIAEELKENEKPKPTRPEIIDNIETEDGFGIDFIDDFG